MPVVIRHRRGFTLIEMLIVGAMIVLFAGLAMIGAQQMYEYNKKKAVQDEVKSLATCLSAARQDVGFYPRIYLLGKSMDLVRFRTGGAMAQYTFVLPAMDTYGFYSSGSPGLALGSINPVFAVTHYWKAPYTLVTETRKAHASGRRSGLVKVRLSDQEAVTFFRNSSAYGDDLSLVDWPTDPWGNPYAVYHICTGAQRTQQNPKGLRMISHPTEEANYCNMVVSYGPNRVPGGGDKPGPNNDYFGFPNASMFVEGDLIGTGADFTMKSVYAQNPQLKLGPQAVQIIQSLECRTSLPGYIGIYDDGSDDIFFKF